MVYLGKLSVSCLNLLLGALATHAEHRVEVPSHSVTVSRAGMALGHKLGLPE